MGGICSKGSADYDMAFSGKLKRPRSFGNKIEEPEVFPVSERYDSGELMLTDSRKIKVGTPARSTSSKVPEIGSLIGRASVVGFEVAVDVLDVLGSSMSNLNLSTGFVSGVASRGNKISILSFEVANTIVKGSNLLKSLSEENIQFLKKEILYSDGVQKLVCTDIEELLTIAAADKREELDIFAKEVIRFGDLCKDPQWHQLGRYFQKLDSELMPHKVLKEEVEVTMQQLMSLAQNTSELYHELHAVDRYAQDYRRKVQEEEALRVTRRGEDLVYLQTELKRQRKLVRSLKKKSLWSKNLEEIMEKLVDVVIFLHQRISDAFGLRDMTPKTLGNVPDQNPQRLGASGLALHYANVIIQIDSIVCRPTSVPPNVRDALYQALPTSVKSAIRSKLQTFQVKEELNASKIKAEMEKTLQWIVPIAQNTTKAHQGFGWVGEWANIGTEMSRKANGQTSIIRIQTLHHARRDLTDEYILELVTWLHHLVSQVKQRDHGFKTTLPNRSPTQKGPLFSLSLQGGRHSSVGDKRIEKVLDLSQEEKEMLEGVFYRKLVPGISKSQELAVRKNRSRRGLTRSSGSSPLKKFGAVKPRKSKLLDVMDGLDTLDDVFPV
ncbi:protein PSK SIMULATOR 1-like [Aristolochia californica]|uniref:protein PSK SIMULATOR 1-like n=1 Tax=Aristolochia californica TaxID=171875 RepID=UPI0035D88E5C